MPYFSIPLATVFISEEEKKLVTKLNSQTSLELIMSATAEKVIMLEIGAAEINEERLEQALKLAQQEICHLIDFFQQIANSLGIKKEILNLKEETIQDE